MLSEFASAFVFCFFLSFTQYALCGVSFTFISFIWILCVNIGIRQQPERDVNAEHIFIYIYRIASPWSVVIVERLEKTEIRIEGKYAQNAFAIFVVSPPPQMEIYARRACTFAKEHQVNRRIYCIMLFDAFLPTRRGPTWISFFFCFFLYFSFQTIVYSVPVFQPNITTIQNQIAFSTHFLFSLTRIMSPTFAKQMATQSCRWHFV